jgi:hypothetical protein
MADAFIEELMRRKWKSVASQDSVRKDIPSRYPSVPDELRQFVSSYEVLCSEDESKWFLSASDFQCARSDGFHWNEFELISMRAANGDPTWKKQIAEFWNTHLPLFMRVDGAYAYAAYCCAGANEGKYVRGTEPEFEEVSVIGRTLPEFKEWVLRDAT